MIYVPNFNNSSCAVVRDSDTIRVYDTTPTHNSTINYVDYYINSNYLYTNGTQQFSAYSTLPICLPKSSLTTNVYYRNDFDKILVIFFLLLIICFYFPYRILSRMFGRWLKW